MPHAIDATVVGIAILSDGNARLTLEGKAGPDELMVMNHPPNIGILYEKPLWGTHNGLWCGKIRIGERANEILCEISEKALTLVEKGWDQDEKKRKGKRK